MRAGKQLTTRVHDGGGFVGQSDDIHEIRQLLARIFHAGDAFDVETWLDCYTDDALFDSPHIHMEGRDELRAGFPQLRGTSPTRHWIGNIVVELDGDDATAMSYLFVVSATFPPEPMVSGVYHDRFRRVDGRWLFSERLLTLDGIARPDADG
jgi:ketosteroid isomerase-like protein